VVAPPPILGPIIEVKNLVKRYGASRGRAAVDDLSFAVDAGEVVGFLGPNGAGKSTTLRIVSGFLGMTSGTVHVAGHDIVEESHEARQKIGYMPEAVPLYPEMRTREYLAFRAELKRVPRAKRASYVDDAMRKANVLDVATTLIGKLSKGYRQRVGLADALVARPPLLVLDEPTAGLDPNQIREVRKVIRELGKEHTVLLSTHILSEVEASCSRVVVIARGKLVAAGTMADLARKRRDAGLWVQVRGKPDTALAALRGLDGVASATASGALDGAPSGDAASDDPAATGDAVGITCTWSKKVDPSRALRATEEAVAALVAAGCFVREVRPVRSSLEEVFAELTRADARDDAAADAAAAADDDDDDATAAADAADGPLSSSSGDEPS